MILPLWMDLYNMAMLVEQVGVGVYASRGTAPGWTVDGLVRGLQRVLDDDEARAMREKAADLGAKTKKRPGRTIAAGVIAGLARSGH